MVAAEVTGTTWNTESLARMVTISGSLRATENHPFYVTGAWTEVGRLSPGDALTSLWPTAAQTLVSAMSVSSVDFQPTTEAVYNRNRPATDLCRCRS